jgi:hypothetical protein
MTCQPMLNASDACDESSTDEPCTYGFSCENDVCTDHQKAKIDENCMTHADCDDRLMCQNQKCTLKPTNLINLPDYRGTAISCFQY